MKKQSIHHAVINNKNTIMCSEKKIYNLVNLGILEVRNIDLPRKVRFKQRSKNITHYKIDKECLTNRKYDNYIDSVFNSCCFYGFLYWIKC